MEPFLEKVCPECGGEYQPTIERCADCGVPLVSPQEIAARDARELPREPGLRPLRTAPILWVRTLAADLDGAGIRYRIDRHLVRAEGVLSVLVRRRDQEAAAEIDAARARLDPPPTLDEEEDEDGEDRWAPAAPREAPAREEVGDEDYRVCPECGGEFLPTVVLCPDCDVELVSPGDADTAADVGEDDDPEADPDVEEIETAPSFLEPPLHELEPEAGLACLCCHSFGLLQRYSIVLDEAGISHRFDAGSFDVKPNEACLYVRHADRSAALAVITHLGEAPEGVELPQETTCPACETPLSQGAMECPGCGLGLAAPIVEDSPCPKCGGLLSARKEICPNCGTISVLA